MASPESDAASARAALAEQLARGQREADPGEVASADARLEELLEQVAAPPAEAETAAASHPAGDTATTLEGVAMRTAVPTSLRGRTVTLRVRGRAEPVEAALAHEVSPELVARAAKSGDAVVVECPRGATPLVVGVLQTRIADELVLEANKVRIEGRDEILLRAGRGAVRLRRDGDVELVGSRVSAMSRGLFRLVGRVLRLN